MAKSEVPGWLEDAITACIGMIDRKHLTEREAIRSLRTTIKQHQEYADALIERHASMLLYTALRAKEAPAKPVPPPETEPVILTMTTVRGQPTPPLSPKPKTAEQIQGTLFPELPRRVRVTVANYRLALQLDAHGLEVSHNLLITQLENARTDGMEKAAKRAAATYARKIEDAEVFYRLFRREIRPDEVVEDVITRLGETKIEELAKTVREEVHG